MKAQGWKTKKRSSKGSLLSHIATSYTHPFSQELIILGVIWGKSPCIYRFSLYSLVRVEQERARYLAGKKEKNKKNRLLGRSERWKFPPLFYTGPFTGGDTREFFLGPTASGGPRRGLSKEKHFFSMSMKEKTRHFGNFPGIRLGFKNSQRVIGPFGSLWGPL